MASNKYPGQYTYDGMTFHRHISLDAIKLIKDFETDISDVCIASYPKCGNTWVSQVVKELHPELCPPDIPLPVSIPFVEFMLRDLYKEKYNVEGLGVTVLKSRKSPRLLKTHMPARYWQKQVEGGRLKVIFVVRNFKDALVSFYYHHLNDPDAQYTGLNFDTLFERVKDNSICYGDFFDCVESWIKLSHLPNVLLIRYEDMKEDLVREMLKINKFCEKNYSQEEIEVMAKECRFDAMKKNPAANFIPGSLLVRKGLVGEWRKYFSQEQSQYVDDRIKEYPEYKKLYPEDF